MCSILKMSTCIIDAINLGVVMKNDIHANEVSDFKKKQKTKDEIFNELDSITEVSILRFVVSALLFVFVVGYFFSNANAGVLIFIVAIQFSLIMLIYSKLVVFENKTKKIIEILKSKD